MVPNLSGEDIILIHENAPRHIIIEIRSIALQESIWELLMVDEIISLAQLPFC